MAMDKAEVVVVGGGIVGVSTAYFLKKEGYDVVLVEQQELAHGASGRNAGYLFLHGRNAGIALDLSRAGAKIYKEDFFPTLGNTFEYRQNGSMIYYYTEEQKKVFEEFVAARQADGLDIRLIDGDEARMRAKILPDNVLGASYCAEDGQIRTPRLVRSLGNECIRLGARIYENTAMLSLITENGQTKGIRTSGGEIYADKVVLASGVWTKVIGETVGIEVPVYPERLGLIRTAPIEKKLIETILYGPTAAKQYEMFRNLPSYKDEYFLDSNEDMESGLENLELFAQLEDGSLLVGCQMDYPDKLDMRPTMEGLKLTIDRFLEQWPQYRTLGVEAAWTGLLPYTADSLPIIDKVEEIEGVYVAAGHVYGNLAGPITGKLVTELIAGKPTSLPLDELKLKRESLKNVEGVTRW